MTEELIKLLPKLMPKDQVVEVGYMLTGTAWDEFTEPPNEVYVMIGNGFDLECGLPTSYSDFLKFLKGIERLSASSADSLDDLDLHPSIRASLLSAPVAYEAWKPAIESFWYEHFQKARLKLRWIDFEAEISKVIRAVERNMDLNWNRAAGMDDYVGCIIGSELDGMLGDRLAAGGILSEDYTGVVNYTTYKLLYSDLRDILLHDLNAVILTFETYLREYVEVIKVEPTENIKFLMERLREVPERYVLTFNYTATFERMLNDAGIDAEFCYIHGKVGDGKSKNRMVLGIDEHLRAEGIRNLIGYTPFRKYNQRIFKATDSNYMDWLANIEGGKTLDRMLYVFGHSIGITDKDIIRPFVMANDMRTVVFYHSEDAFSDQVSNLTAIIGMDEMIRRNGGKAHTMEFRMQA